MNIVDGTKRIIEELLLMSSAFLLLCILYLLLAYIFLCELHLAWNYFEKENL